MLVTGGGLDGLDVEDLGERLNASSDNTRSLYVPPGGPTDDTSHEATNLWREYT
jgi:hypothetical protein